MAARFSGVISRRRPPAGPATLAVCGVLASCAIASAAGVALGAEAAAAPALPLEPLRFLVGTWQGEAGGEPGQGSGSATFAFDLDGRVLVRRSRTTYPPADGKPGIVHDDLLVIHAAQGGGLEAVDFDNEGHVIEYTVAVSPDGKRVEFTSEPEPSSPTFRLTYSQVDANTVDTAFAIAPPGSPTAFRTHVTGRTHRVAR